MARYPYVVNRNGHYYFRVAVPVFHVNALGRRELFYSLKTKDYAEAKVRSAALLNVAQEVFQLVEAQRPDIAIQHLESSLKQLNFQRNQSEKYPVLLAKLSLPVLSAEMVNPSKGGENKRVGIERANQASMPAPVPMRTPTTTRCQTFSNGMMTCNQL